MAPLAYSHDLKIGLIGCGSRGTALAIDALNAQSQTAESTGIATDRRVRLVAVADVFEDRIQQSMRAIRSHHRDQVDVQCRRFSGLEAFHGVLESDADLVILATPPGFRPLHFAAAVAAGKHIYAEKPVAVDAPGVRSFLTSNQLAIEKNLAVVVGLQRRHLPVYQETIRRLKEGAIGDINFCRVYWNQNSTWARPRTGSQLELEYQLRNWHFFNWLSGDHIVEQHVHNLDVINWLLDAHPEKAQGVGGRQIRSGREYGQLYDHHTVEFTYHNGIRLLSMCRQMLNCWNAVGEFAHGSRGWADIGNGKIYDSKHQLIWEASTPRGSSGCGMHALISSLPNQARPNEGQYAAESTMSAIMGRMATYSGKELTWRQCYQSSLAQADLGSLRSLADPPPVLPSADGSYEVLQPGDEISKIL